MLNNNDSVSFIRKIDLNDSYKIYIQMSEYEGKEYLDIRKFYMDKQGEWNPTKQGITIPKNKIETVIPKLQEYLEEIFGFIG